jgi:hypothetical protein
VAELIVNTEREREKKIEKNWEATKRHYIYFLEGGGINNFQISRFPGSARSPFWCINEKWRSWKTVVLCTYVAVFSVCLFSFIVNNKRVGEGALWDHFHETSNAEEYRNLLIKFASLLKGNESNCWLNTQGDGPHWEHNSCYTVRALWSGHCWARTLAAAISGPYCDRLHSVGISESKNLLE